MSALANPSQGLDLTGGVDLATVPEGSILLGHVGDEAMSEAEAREVLARQRGLGEWSIEYFLARGLGRPDCLPAEDVGLRRVVGRYLAGGARLSPEDLRCVLAPFAPYRSLTAYYLAVHARLFRPWAA